LPGRALHLPSVGQLAGDRRRHVLGAHRGLDDRTQHAVDLLDHADQAGAARSDIVNALARALAVGRLDRDRLRTMAARYATRATRELLDAATVA